MTLGRLATLSLLLALLPALCLAQGMRFQDLAKLPQASLITDEFMEGALAGDPLSQVLVVVGLQAQGEDELSMALLEKIWHEVGYVPDQVGPRPRPWAHMGDSLGEIDLPNLMSHYQALAEYHLQRGHAPAGLQLAFAILRANALQGHLPSAEQIGFQLMINPILPESSLLETRWSAYAEGGPSFDLDTLIADVEADAPETAQAPAEEKFGACPPPLDRLPELLSEAAAVQGNAEDDGAGEVLLRSKVDHIRERVGAAHSGNISLSFADMPVAVVAIFASETMGLPEGEQIFFHAPWLSGFRVGIFWKDLPAALLLAQMDRQLVGGGFRCSGPWLQWMPGPEDTAPEPLLVLPLPPLQDTEDGDGQRRLRWVGDASYVGEVVDGLPQGRGVLTLGGADETRNTVQEGDFRRGLLHGEGEIRGQNGSILASGQFQFGRLHGPGRQIDHELELQGEFDQGVLARGLGRIALDAAKYGAPQIEYSGPFEQGHPHGTGTCRGSHFSYPCRFHRGLFVGVGKVLLVADPG